MTTTSTVPSTTTPSTTNTSSSNGSSSSNASSSAAGLSSNFDTFLTLLTTQLKYQDPTSPMDSSQFTNQLVQFSSVEQAIQENAQLGTLISLQQSNQTATAVSYLGKQVEVSGNALPLVNGEGQFSYTLQGAAQTVTVTVTDAAGQPVRTLTGDTTSGRHDMIWDGKDNNGNSVADGVYSFTVAATDRSGNAVTNTTTYLGPVQQVSTANNQVQLSVGGQNVSLGDIITVEPPNAAQSSTLDSFLNSITSLL
jgi:flagellar basal-body rod modification protein FlgD